MPRHRRRHDRAAQGDELTELTALAAPVAERPILFGQPAPVAELLPWSWAEDRLTTARNYWIATTRPGGRPHSRPVWAVWLADGLWFSTGSLARHNLVGNDAIEVHLEDGDEVLILAGTAVHRDDHVRLQAMCDAYGPKYDFPLRPVDGEVRDSDGTGGPAYLVRPEVAFGWEANMASPTRWRFAGA